MLFLIAIDDPENRSLLEKIYITYKKDLYLTAYDMVKNHQIAEDIVHNAIIRANDHIEKISDVKCKKTRSYLVVIVKNLCRDYFKEDMVKGIHMRHLTPIDEFINIHNGDDLIETELIMEETMLEIEEIMDMIKPSYSEVLKLRYYDEMSIDEIATILNIKPSNVGVRINRGIKAIQKIYRERSQSNEEIIE